MCVDTLPAYMFVYRVCAWCLQRPEEDISSPGTAASVDTKNQTQVL